VGEGAKSLVVPKKYPGVNNAKGGPGDEPRLWVTRGRVGEGGQGGTSVMQKKQRRFTRIRKSRQGEAPFWRAKDDLELGKKREEGSAQEKKRCGRP